ncbi:hypothetical protein SmJEL517_g01038 [Synchytrium microbalum]|uniref:Uncharacterized protein n=1 Tax=Synchytrium microbalum TaxID=1806994 RepID=A0A507CDA1_9FUNG|nr:uncharacterized protein SmJEL517_g01038 [Synchytrium microbalum]TPX37149.1 hypothetical protein SmJEL517_g01038 [Synchytrium microbalum]
MVTESMTSSKKHCVLVFPANGCMGYDMCRELCEGAKKEHLEEVYAVCCSSEGKWVDKLKDLGKKCKVICLDKPTDMDCWKKHVTRKVDCMMLCTDPSAMRHMKSKVAEDYADMAKAMECAVEMCHHLNCKCMVETTAYCADDSKYKMWHRIHQCIEMAAEKHFKGHCCVMYHNMMFECIMTNREELRQEKKLSWPVSPNAECCPMSMCDMACCCIEGMRECMKEMDSGSASGVMASVMQSTGMGAASKKHMKYHLTGKDMMTPQMMMDMMSQNLGQAYSYQQVDENQWKQMVQNHMGMMEIEMMMECFRMMDDGKMKHCTHDMKKLCDREPMNMADWIRKHQAEFGPGASAQSSMMM